MQDKGKFRCESEWPIARAQDTPMYFSESGRLLREPCGEVEYDRFDKLEYDPRVGGCAGMHGGGPSSINWFRYVTSFLLNPRVYASRPTS